MGDSLVLLGAATATGAGQSKTLPVDTNDHVFDVSVVDADTSISALSVAIEVTLDGQAINDANAKWAQLTSHTFSAGELTALLAVFVKLDVPCVRIRANILTATGIGAGDTVTVRHRGRYMGRP